MTITGTPIGTVESGTLADLRIQVRRYLADTTVWPNATLTGYIQEAVRFYSVEFPRRAFRSLTLTTGIQEYALWPEVREVLRVEYPAGESPRRYLEWVSVDAAALLAGEDVYAVRPASFDDLDAIAQVMFGPVVATGETAVLHYMGLHTVPMADTDVLSVPGEHLEALHALIDFRAHWQLEADEAVNLSGVAITLSQLGENARRAWNRYKEVTSRLQDLAVPVSASGMAWVGRERIY